MIMSKIIMEIIMAILGPDQLPVVMRIQSDPMKFEILSMLGHPHVNVELSETQLEQSIRVTGDFIAEYFPLEQRFAYFYTQPLITTYDLPPDAYWVQEVTWHPEVTRIGDIFGAESFLFNVGNVTGIQNILTDYHLLQAYRKFSARILGTEGRWEVLGDNRVRLYPNPRGSFPVAVKYIPRVTQWRSPQAREVCKRMMLAEAKIILGNIRSKFNGLPSPDGGSITLNGDALRTEGQEEKKQALEDAVLLGEPLGPFLF
jgi:hypothetical protein